MHIIKQEFLSTGKWIRAVDLNKKMLAQFDEFLNDPKRTCFHGKEYLICKDPDPEGNFIIVGVNFRILPAGTPIVTKDGSII